MQMVAEMEQDHEEDEDSIVEKRPVVVEEKKVNPAANIQPEDLSGIFTNQIDDSQMGQL